MFRITPFRKFMILLLITASTIILSTSCYKDDDESRITIHIERYDLAGSTATVEKRFIDRILEFFSTQAEASAIWSATKVNLTLSITSDTIGKLEFTIPPAATTYTITVPSGNSTTFTVNSTWDSIYNGIQKNMGGEVKVNLLPGDQDLTIQVKPMSFISSVAAPFVGGPGLTVQWLVSGMHNSVSAYKLYRSTDPDGPYTNILTTGAGTYTDTAITVGVRYYYRVSTFGSMGESIPSDIVSGIR